MGIAKDYNKSIKATVSWKRNRYKHLQGIKKFNRSTAGKRVHRNLARTLATRLSRSNQGALGIDTSTPRESRELYKIVSSLITHILIDEYYVDIDDTSARIDACVFETYAIETLSAIQNDLLCGRSISKDAVELLLRLCDEQSLSTAMKDNNISLSRPQDEDGSFAFSDALLMNEDNYEN